MRDKELLLVVDDEEMNRNLLSRRLERCGFQVEVAAGGVEALSKVGNQPYDLILLDQMMPGKSGSEVLQEVRGQYSPSELPVIMVTAVTESGKVAEALDRGANDYITKPIDFTIALARIRAQLSRKHAEAARRASEERYELAARAANDGLWDWDLVANRIYYSQRWKDTMGLAEGELTSSPEEWFSRVHAVDLVALRQAIDDHLANKSPVLEAEYRIRHSDGNYRWICARGIAVRNAAGKPLRMAGSQSDVTETKTMDPLTRLPNRLLFDDRLSAAVERARRDSNYVFSIWFIDLDRFKLVNDTMGHAGGDQLLIQFADRLRGVIGESGVVARLSGDEFALLIEGVSSAGMAAALGDKLLRTFRPPFLLEGQEFFSSASVGVVLSGAEHTSSQEMIRDADVAMYAAKARGRARWAIFDEPMRRRALSRLELERDLRMALPKGQFVIHYQPRVNLETDQILGFEALLRWKHPQRGLMQPNEFIAIAEETGAIRDIGLWVLGEACEQMRKWRERFPHLPELDVSVNVSPVQFRDPAFRQQLEQILCETGLEPARLQIEVTESTLFDNVDEARAMLLAIKNLGVGLKLDDFATGYSCLRYLCRLPFDAIKIDRSFTMDIGDSNPESKELIRTILSMAQNLGLGVIAEGIENRLTAEFLKNQGCKCGQGYFYSPPLGAEEIGEMLRTGVKR